MSQGYSPLLQQLIQALQCLPGVGAKSAIGGVMLLFIVAGSIVFGRVRLAA